MTAAYQIRDVIRYVDRFKDALVVIYLDDEVITSALFSSHIHDISLLHKAGLRTIIVPAARTRINNVLRDAGVSWKMHNGMRITAEDAMPLVKMAAFDAAAPVMTALSADRLTAVIGNWVRARGMGVVDGEDYCTAGEVDRIDIDAVRKVLSSAFVPIFPCIGWSASGRPYNLSSILLAREVAVSLKADKLFFVVAGATITSNRFVFPAGLGTTATDSATASAQGDGEVVRIAAMNTREVEAFIAANGGTDMRQGNDAPFCNQILRLLQLSKEAAKAGVSRVHILDGLMDGVMPCEIFSDLGSGTMIYSTWYGVARPLKNEDIPAVLQLMRPFVLSGRLLPRTGRDILEKVRDYIVYELDGGVRACAALHLYKSDSTIQPPPQDSLVQSVQAQPVRHAVQAEIAAIAVDERFSNIGIGPLLVDNLITRARHEGAESVFILTTQAADWFERLGFKSDSIASIPSARRKKWSPTRGSKVYRLPL